MSDTRSGPSVVTLPDYETPEQLKAEALELGSPMTYQAAEYIERYHRLYAKALVEIATLRKRLGVPTDDELMEDWKNGDLKVTGCDADE